MIKIKINERIYVCGSLAGAMHFSRYWKSECKLVDDPLI